MPTRLHRLRVHTSCDRNRRREAVGRTKKFAQIRAFGLVRRQIQAPGSIPKTSLFIRQQAFRGSIREAPGACVVAVVQRGRHKKTALNAAFFNIASLPRASRCASGAPAQGSAAPWSR
jgi:hypothetical protein